MRTHSMTVEKAKDGHMVSRKRRPLHHRYMWVRAHAMSHMLGSVSTLRVKRK
jgi:hypothetical protein